MPEIGEQILLRLPDASGVRTLHLGAVLEAEDGACTAEFEGEATWPEPGGKLAAYFLDEGTFFEQPAVVDDITTRGTTTTVVVRLTGERVTAESRLAPRVSTVATDLIATVDEEEDCPLIDISETGFAIMASEIHSVGDVVSVTLTCAGRTFAGRASVQSARELWEGRFRYGLHGIADDAGSVALTGALREIARSLGVDA